MSSRLLLVSLLLATFLLPACAARESDVPTRDECLAVRDRVVDLQLGVAAHELDPELAAHRDQLRAASSDAFVDQCLRARSRAYVACASAATSLDQLAVCDRR